MSAPWSDPEHDVERDLRVARYKAVLDYDASTSPLRCEPGMLEGSSPGGSEIVWSAAHELTKPIIVVEGRSKLIASVYRVVFGYPYARHDAEVIESAGDVPVTLSELKWRDWVDRGGQLVPGSGILRLGGSVDYSSRGDCSGFMAHAARVAALPQTGEWERPDWVETDGELPIRVWQVVLAILVVSAVATIALVLALG